MNIDEARKILEKDRSLGDPVKNRIFEGMKVITEVYEDEDPGMNAAHDQIWYGDFEWTVEQMTEDQVKYMARCYWFENEESWSTFV